MLDILELEAQQRRCQRHLFQIGKLMRHGEGWKAAHPEREAITHRYLKHQRSLVDDATTTGTSKPS